jgi:hypothetical protein
MLSPGSAKSGNKSTSAVSLCFHRPGIVYGMRRTGAAAENVLIVGYK